MAAAAWTPMAREAVRRGETRDAGGLVVGLGKGGAGRGRASDGGGLGKAGHAPLGSPSRRVFPLFLIPCHPSARRASLDGCKRAAKVERGKGRDGGRVWNG
jgi:hypothetical protein